jgi:serine/threonine protein kinase
MPVAGAFLGAGSFGKVFRGQWNGIDVAVKVIEHTGASAAEVQQEMEILMSLQHPNIVRCVHRMRRDSLACSQSWAPLATHRAAVLQSNLLPGFVVSN